MNNRKTLLAAALASSLVLSSPSIMAHSSSPEYLPIVEVLNSSGASYKLSDDKSELLIESGDAKIRVPFGESQAFYNERPVELSAPVKMQDGNVLVERNFAHEVFASQVSQNIVIGNKTHPKDPLTALEITKAANAVKASSHYKDGIRFTQIRLADPNKEKVWEWAFGEGHDFSRQAIFTVVDGRKVIEGTVDLQSGEVLRWEHIEGAYGYGYL